MIHELAAHRLYAVRPDDAVEILLACLVDEAPTDEIGASRLDRDLGLQADGDPTRRCSGRAPSTHCWLFRPSLR